MTSAVGDAVHCIVWRAGHAIGAQVADQFRARRHRSPPATRECLSPRKDPVMNPQPYRFVIDESVPLAEAEMSLQLAMIALEGLFGQARVRLEARYQVVEPHRALLVDVSTPVGASVARVFASLLIREFGDDSFSV